MDSQILVDIADTVSRIKMYPYFDIANYALMCMAVREDTPQTGETLLLEIRTKMNIEKINAY